MGGGGRAGCHQEGGQSIPRWDGTQLKGCGGSRGALLPRQAGATAACLQMGPTKAASQHFGWAASQGRDKCRMGPRMGRAGHTGQAGKCSGGRGMAS